MTGQNSVRTRTQGAGRWAMPETRYSQARLFFAELIYSVKGSNTSAITCCFATVIILLQTF